MTLRRSKRLKSKKKTIVTPHKPTKKKKKRSGRLSSRKKSKTTYGKSYGNHMTRKEIRDSQRDKRNAERRRDYHRDKRINIKMTEDMKLMAESYELQQTEREIETAQCLNDILQTAERRQHIIEALESKLNKKADTIEALEAKLREHAYDEQDDVYIEETLLEDDDEDDHDLDQSDLLFGVQSLSKKRYRRYSVKVIAMTADLNANGVIAEHIPHCIHTVLETYTDLNIDAIRIPTAQVIRHWIKYYYAILNQVNVSSKISAIGKTELISSGHAKLTMNQYIYTIIMKDYR